MAVGCGCRLKIGSLILEEVARTLCQMHKSGWAWRSISTRHVFPQRAPSRHAPTQRSGVWEIWLIDCEGVHRARSTEILHRDFRRFLRALAHDRADEQTLEMMRRIGSQLAFPGTSGGHSEPVKTRQASGLHGADLTEHFSRTKCRSHKKGGLVVRSLSGRP